MANLKEPANLVLQIPRAKIEAQNIASTLEKLLVLSDTHESAMLRKACLALSVSGYDNDPRELCEIPEVRSFFKRLTHEWPFWFWFLARDAGQISLLMSLVCEVKVHRQGMMFGIEFDEQHLRATIGRMLSGSTPMFIALDIPPTVANESTTTALQELQLSPEIRTR